MKTSEHTHNRMFLTLIGKCQVLGICVCMCVSLDILLGVLHLGHGNRGCPRGGNQQPQWNLEFSSCSGAYSDAGSVMKPACATRALLRASSMSYMIEGQTFKAAMQKLNEIQWKPPR